MDKDDLTFDLPPQSLDAAFEREAILSGLVRRADACFPENRLRLEPSPDHQRRATDLGTGHQRYEKSGSNGP